MRNPLAASNLLDLITLILYLRQRKFHQREQLHGQVASPKSYSTHLSCRVTLRNVYLTSLAFASGGCSVCSHLHPVCSAHEQCLCHASHRYNMSAGRSSGIPKRWRDNGGVCFRLPTRLDGVFRWPGCVFVLRVLASRIGLLQQREH